MDNGERQKLKDLTIDMVKVQDKLDLILTNHLPHIQAELETMKIKFWILFLGVGFILGILATNLLGKL